MRRFRLPLAPTVVPALALAALTAAAAPARAQQVLYSNPLTYRTNKGTPTIPTASGFNAFAAQRFTLTGPAIVTGFGYNAIVDGSAYGTSVNYRVLTALGGAPGTALLSGSAAVAHSAGPMGHDVATTNYSFVVPALPLLAGDYFLALQEVTTNRLDFLSYGTATSGAYESTDGGTTYTAGYGQGNSTAPTAWRSR